MSWRMFVVGVTKLGFGAMQMKGAHICLEAVQNVDALTALQLTALAPYDEEAPWSPVSTSSNTTTICLY